MQTARIVRVGGTEADRQVLETVLRGVGQSDVRTLPVAQALEVVTERKADLLVLDLMLNSSDVFTLLRAAGPGNGRASRVAVIVSAPETFGDRIQACLQRGAEDYVLTPLSEENSLLITRRIELCLQRRELREFTIRLRTAPSGPNEQAFMEHYANASSRFVPREFLEHLQRKTLADVRLGDHVQANMTVFFSDIRDFTALSEDLTPQQNFDFLNSYLKQVTPIVRARRGFVDKYIGDAIMALFPLSPADALQAAVDLQHQVVKYNLGRKAAGYVPVRIGIGLHRGDLILGTIGEEERMQTTVIADAVNVASRIEGLTKAFGVPLLISSTVVEDLEPNHGFKIRRLGAVRAKGKTQSVEIFECFNCDSAELIEHKERTAELFGAAVAEFRKGMFLTAGKIFTRIAQLCPADTVAAYYRDRCSLTLVRERDRDWDGAERIEVN